jgi:hypothetical protein
MLEQPQRDRLSLIRLERAEPRAERHVAQPRLQPANVPGVPNASSHRAPKSRDGDRCPDSIIEISEAL